MPLLVYGLNHLTTSLDMRGRLTVPSDSLQVALASLQQAVPELEEAAILSTCNRIEIHGYASRDVFDAIFAWLACFSNVPASEFGDSCYQHTDQQAAAHLMRVASGLDSQILGEPQIQGQFKVAYQQARACGTVGKELGLIEDFSLRTAKQVRTETQIGAKPVSVAYAAIAMAKQIFANFSQKSILLIGAGTNIRLIAKYLRGDGATSFTIANRTQQNATTLATEINGKVLALSEVGHHLHEFDLVISSTASATTVITADMLTRAIKRRRHKTVFIADLAVPRDVEAAAGEINDVYLYTVDDLAKIISQSIAERQAMSRAAEHLITEGVNCYVEKRRVQVAATLLASYRSQVDTIRETCLIAAQKKLDDGENATSVLAKLAYDLANQLAHKPTISIREASVSNNEQFLHLLKNIYELEN